jgi:uncharacterized membrane protein YhhN
VLTISQGAKTMGYFRYLLVPAVLGVIALFTDWLPAKMGVPLACALILLLAWRSDESVALGRDSLWVVAALVFSAAGDYFLSNKAGQAIFFVIGIGLYLLAHLGYLGFAWANGRLNRKVFAIALLLYLPYGLFLLRPAIADALLFCAVLAYLLISCLVFAVACGLRMAQPGKGLYQLGIGLIVLSDSIISFSEFLHFQSLDGLILPTYYLAHLCITTALLLRLQGPGNRRVAA